MRITTWNVNGLRAALQKGFAETISRLEPDVLLLQEIRTRPDQLPAEWAEPAGWHVWWHPAERPGYSGTAVWSRHPIEKMGCGLGRLGSKQPDPEGRVLHVKVAGLWLLNIYLPSGSASPERHASKWEWLTTFRPQAEAWARSRSPLLLGGDLNIAHTERDIFYAKSNEKNSGFTPEERAWMSEFLECGWVDLIRHQAGEVQGPYSWWSNRGQARKLDRGWRIDYLLANRAAARRVCHGWIEPPDALTLPDQTFAISDHAPVTVEVEV